jgi:cytochrome b
MACCVFMAAIFALVAAIKALLLLTRSDNQSAQEWRLQEREEEYG